MRLSLPDERLALCGLLGLSTMIAAASAAERHLLLDVLVNNRVTGMIVEFLERDGHLLATPKDLRSLGLVLPENVRLQSTEPMVPLSDLPGLDTSLDESAQQLRITAAPEAIEPTLLGAAAEEVTPPASDFGAVLNYDVLATGGHGTGSATALLEGRIFSPFGVLATSLLAESGGLEGFDRDRDRLVRLNTTFTYDDPDTMRRYALGDVVSSGVGWSRPVRLGGFQIARNFAMRPDLVTFPLPSIGGVAAVPSTVDVLVNGVRQLSTDVQPGPFAVRQLPVVTGNGEVMLVIRDALGREVTRTLPFYAASALLAAGLSSYSVEGGWVRRNFGTASDDYQEPVASGTLRYGVTDWLTAEAHAEAMAGQSLAGAGAAMAVQGVGLLSLSGAASMGQGGDNQAAGPASGGQGRGWLASAGLERSGGPFNLNASLTLASPGFRDIAGMAGDPVPRRVARASAGLSLGDYGMLGLAYVGIDRVVANVFGRSTPSSRPESRMSRSGLLSATWSRSLLGRATIYATAYQDIANRRDFGAMLGISMALGDRSSAGISGGLQSDGGYGDLQMAQAALAEGDLGWRLATRQGQSRSSSGEVEYRAGWSRLTGGIDQAGPQSYGRLGVQGAIAVMGDSVYATNPIRDSFAVVRTGQPDITVLQENRPIGRTDSGGNLLVPDLRAYERNRLAINPADLPPDAVLDRDMQEVRPAAGSGVTVAFPVRRQSSARLRLVDAAGKPLPIGSYVHRAATATTEAAKLPVGYDGEAFLSELQPENTMIVQLPDGRRCSIHFSFKAEADGLPLIGLLPCR
jgi:outer membrane usher protein